MQKIVPHLWFDREAVEAANFYASIFPDASIISMTTLEGTPSGSVDVVSMDILDHEFMFISAGPDFKFTPAVSFLAAFDTPEQVAEIFSRLANNGSVLMELGAYPFSDKYGWVQDRFGVSWQIMYTDGREIKQKITPTLMFTGGVSGKAEEAINYYLSVFHDAKSGEIMRYGSGEEPDKEGTVKYAAFVVEGREFAAMDSAGAHTSGFNEAISFIVRCQDQDEIDYYWEKLSAVPEAEQCGWLKDKYGVSWQIVPAAMDELMRSHDREKVARVTEAFLKMKKFDLAELEKAAAGR